LTSAIDHFNDNLVKLAKQYAAIILREHIALTSDESKKQKTTYEAELEKKHASLLAMQVERDAAVKAAALAKQSMLAAVEAQRMATEAKDALVQAKDAAIKAKDAAVEAKNAAVKAKDAATAAMTESNNEYDILRDAMLVMVARKRPQQKGGSADAGTDNPDHGDAAPEGLEGSAGSGGTGKNAAGDGSKKV